MIFLIIWLILRLWHFNGFDSFIVLEVSSGCDSLLRSDNFLRNGSFPTNDNSGRLIHSSVLRFRPFWFIQRLREISSVVIHSQFLWFPSSWFTLFLWWFRVFGSFMLDEISKPLIHSRTLKFLRRWFIPSSWKFKRCDSFASLWKFISTDSLWVSEISSVMIHSRSLNVRVLWFTLR